MTATPILDLVKPLTEAPKSWHRYALGVVIGLVIAAIPILADQDIAFNWNWPALNGLLVLPALVAASAVHELGHFLAAILTGLDVGAVSIGPFLLLKSGGRWVFRFEWQRVFGGFVKPLSTIDRFRLSSYAWTLAAGPIASLLLAGVCWLSVARFGNGFWQWTGTLFWTSLFLGVLSTAPFSTGLQKTDGAKLWQLLRHPEQVRTQAILIALQTEETAGVRPRDWNPELVAGMAAIDYSAIEFLNCQLLLFYRFLDEEREDAALPYLERALSKSAKASNLVRASLFAEAAGACARIKGDADKARVWRQRALPLLRNRPQALYTVDASLAMCEGRYDEAIRLWQSAREQMLKKKVDSGLIRFALDKWDKLESVCKSSISGVS